MSESERPHSDAPTAVRIAVAIMAGNPNSTMPDDHIHAVPHFQRFHAATPSSCHDLHCKPLADYVPMALRCPNPACGKYHIDRGEWLTRFHKTHRCEHCRNEWKPFDYATVGVPPDAGPRWSRVMDLGPNVSEGERRAAQKEWGKLGFPFTSEGWRTLRRSLGRDARGWAVTFSRMNDLTMPSESTLEAWFASAIMAGHEAARPVDDDEKPDPPAAPEAHGSPQAAVDRMRAQLRGAAILTDLLAFSEEALARFMRAPRS